MTHLFLKPNDFNRLNTYANCLKFALSVTDSQIPIEKFEHLRNTGDIKIDFIQKAQEFGITVRYVPRGEKLKSNKIYFIVWGWYPRYQYKGTTVIKSDDSFYIARLENGFVFHKPSFNIPASNALFSELKMLYPENDKQFIFEFLDQEEDF